MIEMLGVLAIVGVLSIGGIALYRRAVNNHHANTILDDVNRFAFAIIEKGSYPLGQVIPKGDFKESGIYMLEGYQDAESNQFSITVANVPKGVCEPLLDKATVEYKVRVNQSANEMGPLYDSLNTDLCHDNNIMVFYFGDTAGVCNVPDDDGPTPCTTNADCCGGEFCAFLNPPSNTDEGDGTCESIMAFSPETKTMDDGNTWTRSLEIMNWWSTRNWCAALGLKTVSRGNIGCAINDAYCTTSSILQSIQKYWTSPSGRYYWLENINESLAFVMGFSDSHKYGASHNGNSWHYAFCR